MLFSLKAPRKTAHKAPATAITSKFFHTTFSMKQTNNAIKFLMAQYRAIFKNAYFKGMATALVLTAGLSAGQAQAAYEGKSDYFGLAITNSVSLNSGAISTNPNGSWTDQSTGSLPNNKYHLAGKVGETSASGGTLNVTYDNSVLGSVLGGIVVSTSNIGSLSATHNTLNIKDDTNAVNLGESAYGAYVNASAGGDVFASDNTIDIGGNVAIGTNWSNLSDANDKASQGVFGVRIKTADGNARAENNHLIITSSGNTFAIASPDENGIIGALAEGTDTVVVTGNTVKITENAQNRQLSLTNVDTIRGGFAVNQNSTQANNASILTARDNSVDLTNVKLGVDNSGAWVMGGIAMNQSGGAGTYSALNNTVKLTGSAISYGGSTANGDLQIIGNAASAQKSGVADQDVIANGDGSTTTLEISSSTISMLNSAETNGLTPVAIMGGFAETVSGDATASQNIVKISDTTITNLNTFAALATGSGDSAQVVSSNNELAIDGSSINYDSTTAAAYATTNDIMGTRAEVKFSAGAKASVTANDNTVIVTYSAPTAAAPKVSVDGNIHGAFAVTSSSGATVTVNRNSVDIGDNVVVEGNIYGAEASNNAKMAENTVVFNGELTGKDIIGAAAGADSSTPTKVSDVKTVLTNNTVTIGESAVLKDVSIHAAKTTSNTNIIHEGNNTTINGIYAVTTGSETLSQDNLQVNGSATIYNKGTLTIAGIEQTASSAYYNGTGTIAAGAKVVNEGTINIYNSLNVEGDDTLIAGKNAAVLVIDGGKDGASNLTDYTESLTDGATLKISETGLKNYLTYTDNTSLIDLPTAIGGAYHDDAGAVDVTSGGAIDFRDTVTLSNFDFNTTGSPVAGSIDVDTGLNGGSGSIFRADTVNIEHTLASDTTLVDSITNNKPPYTAINAAGIVVEADTLNLGTSSLYAEDTAKINFGYALVNNSVNFANGALKDKTATDKYDGFRLTSEVVLDAKQEVKDEVGMSNNHFHPLTGTINGDFRLQATDTGATTTDSGAIHVINGIWTATNQVTLASGGSINVGDTITEQSNNFLKEDSVFTTDAILTLDNALDVDLSDTSDAEINVSGSAGTNRYDLADYGTQDAHDGQLKLALLDLRAGIDLIGDSNSNNKLVGTAGINASNSGVILVDGANLSDILAESGRALTTGGNNGGILFSISSNAQLVADGNVSAEFNDFGSGVTTGIKLNGSGYFVADGLTLTTNNTQATHQDDSAYVGTAGNTIDFNGNIEVNELTITDNTETNKPSGSTVTSPYASSVTVSSGNVEIAKSLTVQNDTLNVSGASFEFATDSVAASGAITVNNIKVAQKGTNAGDVNEIAFTNGTWDATGTTFTLNTGAGLQVGGDLGEDINDLETEAVVNINRVVANAGSNIDVDGDGNLTISTVDFSKLAANSGAVKVRGNLTIEGDAPEMVCSSVAQALSLSRTMVT